MALVLTRRIEQAVLVNTSDGVIRITVTRVSDGPCKKVRMAIDAPQTVAIVREEIQGRYSNGMEDTDGGERNSDNEFGRKHSAVGSERSTPSDGGEHDACRTGPQGCYS